MDLFNEAIVVDFDVFLFKLSQDFLLKRFLSTFHNNVISRDDGDVDVSFEKISPSSLEPKCHLNASSTSTTDNDLRDDLVFDEPLLFFDNFP